MSSTSKTLKCFNPLAMLPLELAQMVCNYLDLCDKMYDPKLNIGIQLLMLLDRACEFTRLGRSSSMTPVSYGTISTPRQSSVQSQKTLSRSI